VTWIRVFEHDPELLDGLPELARRVAAHEGIADSISLPRSDLDFTSIDGYGVGIGFLIVDGMLARDVSLDGGVREWLELVGPGDLICPQVVERTTVSITSTSTWRVLEPARLAVLDLRFVTRISRWPEITTALMDRLAARTRRLGFHLAVCQLRRVDVRILAVFWHLAERWGRMTPSGALIPVRLTHEHVAKIVGAHRPTVSAALKELVDRGALDRTARGAWIVRGPAPTRLEDLELRAAGGLLAAAPRRRPVGTSA
jgi:CRP/FNR family transcriptional regulator, cyclic AMP receptor protein